MTGDKDWKYWVRIEFTEGHIVNSWGVHVITADGWCAALDIAKSDFLNSVKLQDGTSQYDWSTVQSIHITTEDAQDG